MVDVVQSSPVVVVMVMWRRERSWRRRGRGSTDDLRVVVVMVLRADDSWLSVVNLFVKVVLVKGVEVRDLVVRNGLENDWRLGLPKRINLVITNFCLFLP